MGFLIADETHIYTNGHTCVPNSVGDYDLMCSGKKVQFVPSGCYYGLKRICPMCGEHIELITPLRPFCQEYTNSG